MALTYYLIQAFNIVYILKMPLKIYFLLEPFCALGARISSLIVMHIPNMRLQLRISFEYFGANSADKSSLHTTFVTNMAQ